MDNIQENGNQVKPPRFAMDCERSDKIESLAKALAKAQSQMEMAEKKGRNPFFNSSYADLSSIIKAAKKPLSENGLSITQLMHPSEQAAIVTTVLLHETGQYLTSTIQLTPKVHDPQGMGSAITYARRYAYGAIIGLSSEDDDGNAASDKAANPATKSLPSRPVAIKPAKPQELKPGMITTKMVDEIIATCEKKNKPVSVITTAYKIKGLNELTLQQGEIVLRRLNVPDSKESVDPDEVAKGIEEQKKKDAEVKATVEAEKKAMADKEPALNFQIAWLKSTRDDLLDMQIITKEDLETLEFVNAGEFKRIEKAYKSKKGLVKS